MNTSIFLLAIVFNTSFLIVHGRKCYSGFNGKKDSWKEETCGDDYCVKVIDSNGDVSR